MTGRRLLDPCRDERTRPKPFESLFTASSETGQNPVGMTPGLRLATASQLPAGEYVWFKRLQSASVTSGSAPDGYAFRSPGGDVYPGAVYRGLRSSAPPPARAGQARRGDGPRPTDRSGSSCPGA
jgi:hypothetical protein